MEKYRQFADAGTGVNPFVPPWVNTKTSLGLRALKFFPLLAVALIRLCFLLVALLWLALAEFILLPIPGCTPRRLLYRIFTKIGCSAALWGLGVTTVEEHAADHRRLKIAPGKKTVSPGADANAGTLVLANHQSVADILYFGSKLGPVFVFVGGGGVPVQRGLLGAFRYSLGPPSKTPPLGKHVTLAEVAKRARSSCSGPVVVFPEGTRSNGASVLAWKDETFKGLEDFQKPFGTSLCGLEYGKGGSFHAYTPHHTVGRPLFHILFMALQPWHKLSVTWLAACDVERVVQGKPLEEQRALCRTLITRMVPGAVEADVQAETHVDFLDYWNNASKKKYIQKKKA